jgi:hypothetical protein
MIKILKTKKYYKLLNIKFANEKAEILGYLQENFERYDFTCNKMWEYKPSYKIIIYLGNSKLEIEGCMKLSELKNIINNFKK